MLLFICLIVPMEAALSLPHIFMQTWRCRGETFFILCIIYRFPVKKISATDHMNFFAQKIWLWLKQSVVRWIRLNYQRLVQLNYHAEVHLLKDLLSQWCSTDPEEGFRTAETLWTQCQGHCLQPATAWAGFPSDPGPRRPCWSEDFQNFSLCFEKRPASLEASDGFSHQCWRMLVNATES